MILLRSLPPTPSFGNQRLTLPSQKIYFDKRPLHRLGVAPIKRSRSARVPRSPRSHACLRAATLTSRFAENNEALENTGLERRSIRKLVCVCPPMNPESKLLPLCLCCESEPGILGDPHLGPVCPDCYAMLTATRVTLEKIGPGRRDRCLFERGCSRLVSWSFHSHRPLLKSRPAAIRCSRP